MSNPVLWMAGAMRSRLYPSRAPPKSADQSAHKKTKGPRSANRLLIPCVKTAFNFCCKFDDLDANPASSYQKPAATARVTSFSPKKEKQIYAATNEAHGKPKVFRDSAISNLTEFFDRFQRLNIQSNEDLDQLVESARQVISGVSPQDLRDRHAGRPSEHGF